MKFCQVFCNQDGGTVGNVKPIFLQGIYFIHNFVLKIKTKCSIVEITLNDFNDEVIKMALTEHFDMLLTKVVRFDLFIFLCIYPPDSQESDGGANT